MLTLWGRTNSPNVQKVLWLLEELALPYRRIDAGLQFGRVNDPDFRALNPNGKIPVLEDGPVVLWETNSILRYLVMQHGGPMGAELYPQAPAARASVDRWLDWQLSTLSPAERVMFWGLVRTPPAERDWAAIDASVAASATCWRIVEARLAAAGPFVEGPRMTLADIVLGTLVHRWFAVEVEGRPDFPALRRWYDALHARHGFRRWVGIPLT
ncbi:glutathione S-transferase family protein [Falsiroseomonas oryzae]|uniref:glutathione S-transferase family protein n=1 Tax=Falsiroseomonas oryzae TaxID=2766473 RepID=UPI0022EB1205|nr:glutathione S-transferase family protein [Roseomonas sp. MO-31]